MQRIDAFIGISAGLFFAGISLGQAPRPAGFQAAVFDTYHQAHGKALDEHASEKELIKAAKLAHDLSLNSYGYVAALTFWDEAFITSRLAKVRPDAKFPQGSWRLRIKFGKTQREKLQRVELSRLRDGAGAIIPGKHYSHLNIVLLCRKGTDCRDTSSCKYFQKCGGDFEFDSLAVRYRAMDKGDAYELFLSEREFWIRAESKEFFTSRTHGVHAGIGFTIHDDVAYYQGSFPEVVIYGLRDPTGARKFAKLEHIRIVPDTDQHGNPLHEP